MSKDYVAYGSITNRLWCDCGVSEIDAGANPDRGVPEGQFLLGVYDTEAKAEERCREYRAKAEEIIQAERQREERLWA